MEEEITVHNLGKPGQEAGEETMEEHACWLTFRLMCSFLHRPGPSAGADSTHHGLGPPTPISN